MKSKTRGSPEWCDYRLVVDGLSRSEQLTDYAPATIACDALDRETRYFHDERGSVVKTIFADDSITTATYDLLGRKIAETDQLGLTKNYEYDKQSRLTAVELPAVSDPNNSNQLTRPRYEYEYDVYGNHTLIHDSLGRETRFTFDEHGRQLTRTLPMGETEEFRYNNFGQQVVHVSFEGVVTETRYENNANGQGRVDEKRYFDNIVTYAEGAGVPSETVDYDYDSKGRLASTTQASLNGAARTEQLTHGDEDRVTGASLGA